MLDMCWVFSKHLSRSLSSGPFPKLRKNKNVHYSFDLKSLKNVRKDLRGGGEEVVVVYLYSHWQAHVNEAKNPGGFCQPRLTHSQGPCLAERRQG